MSGSPIAAAGLAAPGGRFEHKFRLDPFRYRAALAAVRAHMRRDGHSRAAPGGAYYVRSLYFDSDRLDAYVEKMAGEARRVKLRLRVYDADPARAPFVSVELKCRQGMAVLKHASRVGVAAYRAWARDGVWPDAEDPVCLAFERAQRRAGQRPTVLVDYRREAFAPRGPRGLRVTFDHRVRAAHATDLFAAPRWRCAAPHAVVLEIKARGTLPAWLEKAIRELGLVAVPNSKYTQAVEQAYPGLWP